MPDRAIEELAAKIARLDTRIQAMGTPQLANSAIMDGAVDQTLTVPVTDDEGNQLYDEDGLPICDTQTVARFGLQEDGSNTLQVFNGPQPPQPVEPIVTSGPGFVSIEWTGEFVDAFEAFADFDYVGIHLGTEAGFTPNASTLKGSMRSRAGETVVVQCDEGTYYVSLVTVSQAGIWSEPSTFADASGAPVGVDVTAREMAQAAQAAADAADEKASDALAKTSELDDRLATAQSDLNASKERLGDAESKLSTARADINAANGNITSLTSRVGSAETTIVSQGTTITQMKAQGTDLVRNGNGAAKDNSNFDMVGTFNAQDAPTGAAGSFYALTTASMTGMIRDLIPYSPSKAYQMSLDARQTVAGGTGLMYAYLAPFDAAGNIISPSQYMWVKGTTTTLAKPLKRGDTTVTLTDATNWYGTPTKAAGASTHWRSFIFWNWVDSFGKTWGPGTYSRYTWKADAWADGGVDPATGVVTLKVPWAGDEFPAGHPVSNGSSGGTYVYMAGTPAKVPEVWTNYAATYPAQPKALDQADYHSTTPTGVAAAWNTPMPPGTANVRIGFMFNYPGPGNNGRHAVANVSFSDASAAALSVANGKSKVTYSNAVPSGAASAGDTWFVTDSSNNVLSVWKSNGTTWAKQAIDGATLKPDSVTSTQIAANAVTASELAAKAVGTAALADNAVTATQISDGAISTPKLAAGAVTASTIQAGAVGAAAIAAGSVDASKIKAGSITSTEIAADTITSSNIAAGAVTASEIAAGTITADQIAAKTITSAEIATGTITAESGVIADAAIGSAQIINLDTSKLVASSATMDQAVIDQLYSNTVVAKKVSADLLTSGRIQAGVVISAGDPTKTHAELNENGLIAYTEDPEDGIPNETVRLGTGTGDTLAIVDPPTGASLASISQEGKGAFTSVSSAADIEVQGNPLLGTMADLPISSNPAITGSMDMLSRGVVASAINQDMSIDSIVTEYGLGEISFTQLPGRQYSITATGLALSCNTADSSAIVRLRYTTDGSAPTITSSQTASAIVEIGSASQARALPPIQVLGRFNSAATTPVTVRLLLTVQRYYGTGIIGVKTYLGSSAFSPMRMWVRDEGPDIPDTWLYNAGGGTLNTGVKTEAPVVQKQTYTKTYTSTGSATYRGNGSKRTDTPDVVHGAMGSNGNQQGIWLFPDMTNDLKNADIKKIEVYAYANHWYYNSGGAAKISLHGYSAAPASNPNTSGTAIVSSGWPKPGGRWITLPTSNYDGFKTGQWRGFGVGPAPTTAATYYGRFNGGSGARIRVTYVK